MILGKERKDLMEEKMAKIIDMPIGVFRLPCGCWVKVKKLEDRIGLNVGLHVMQNTYCLSHPEFCSVSEKIIEMGFDPVKILARNELASEK